MNQKIYIRNMVCNRCIMVVKAELNRLAIDVVSVELGEAELFAPLDRVQRENLEAALQPLGFQLIDDRREVLIDRIKTLIVELVHSKNKELKVTLSDYLSERLHHDYNYISNLFSEIEGLTIEKYFIAQRIERVKELIVYGESTLSQIAFELNYSSVAHLSAQFKKVTGLTPSHFKQIKANKRKPLDKV